MYLKNIPLNGRSGGDMFPRHGMVCSVVVGMNIDAEWDLVMSARRGR